jgi:RNA polymerase sigma factor (sigma-70 family)
MCSQFETEWPHVRQQVMAYCRRSAANPTDAEDIFQQVAIRAWRGYATFRGDGPLIAWVMSITRKEVMRHMGRARRRGLVESSLETLAEFSPELLPSVPADQLRINLGTNWVRDIANQFAASGLLTEDEHNVVIARLSSPELSWEQIGYGLGVDGATCAVIHCRAIPKLRVGLFLYRQDLLGGRGRILQALAEARSDVNLRMTVTEVSAFERIVLSRVKTPRVAGSTHALRSACAKVIKYISAP